MGQNFDFTVKQRFWKSLQRWFLCLRQSENVVRVQFQIIEDGFRNSVSDFRKGCQSPILILIRMSMWIQFEIISSANAPVRNNDCGVVIHYWFSAQQRLQNNASAFHIKLFIRFIHHSPSTINHSSFYSSCLMSHLHVIFGTS